MSATKPLGDPTGKLRAGWYVVGYACRRGEVNYWHCMCPCRHFVERLVPEPELQKKAWQERCPCEALPKDELTDRIWGLWTIVGRVEPSENGAPESWRCRCACGTLRDFRKDDFHWDLNLSCGCGLDMKISFERRLRHEKASKAWRRAEFEAKRRSRERELDKEWTAAMDRALRSFMPTCAVCGHIDGLVTDHVLPLSKGYGLKPGNAVRLCKTCNSVKGGGNRNHEMSRTMADRINRAAAMFKQFWDEGSKGASMAVPTLAQVTLTAVGPDLIDLLRAIARGDEGAVGALADWLERHSDPRHLEVRRLMGAKLDTGEMTPLLSRLLQSQPRLREEFPKVKEDRAWWQVDAAWRLLTDELSWNERYALMSYLGINSSGRVCTMEELAMDPRKFFRVELALDKFKPPTPRPS